MILDDLARLARVLWILFLVSAVFVFPVVKIVRRTGHSGWWVVLWFIPIIGLAAPWILAYVRWPALEKTQLEASPSSDA
jgi:hypothetical protein